jgi:hypothetical protein
MERFRPTPLSVERLPEASRVGGLPFIPLSRFRLRPDPARSGRSSSARIRLDTSRWVQWTAPTSAPRRREGRPGSPTRQPRIAPTPGPVPAHRSTCLRHRSAPGQPLTLQALSKPPSPLPADASRPPPPSNRAVHSAAVTAHHLTPRGRLSRSDESKRSGHRPRAASA